MPAKPPSKPQYPISLGQGNYREALLVNRRHVVKRPLSVPVGATLLQRARHHTRKAIEHFFHGSYNHLEWENYKRVMVSVPKPLRRNFARISLKRSEGKSPSIQIRVLRDFDGKISPPLKGSGVVRDPYFWRQFDLLVSWMVRSKNYFMDFNARNVLVRRIDAKRSIPVIVDFKRVGAHSFPAHVWLRIPALARSKMLRRISRRIKKYRGMK